MNFLLIFLFFQYYYYHFLFFIVYFLNKSSNIAMLSKYLLTSFLLPYFLCFCLDCSSFLVNRLLCEPLLFWSISPYLTISSSSSYTYGCTYICSEYTFSYVSLFIDVFFVCPSPIYRFFSV